MDNSANNLVRPFTTTMNNCMDKRDPAIIDKRLLKFERKVSSNSNSDITKSYNCCDDDDDDDKEEDFLRDRNIMKSTFTKKIHHPEDQSSSIQTPATLTRPTVFSSFHHSDGDREFDAVTATVTSTAKVTERMGSDDLPRRSDIFLCSSLPSPFRTPKISNQSYDGTETTASSSFYDQRGDDITCSVTRMSDDDDDHDQDVGQRKCLLKRSVIQDKASSLSSPLSSPFRRTTPPSPTVLRRSTIPSIPSPTYQRSPPRVSIGRRPTKKNMPSIGVEAMKMMNDAYCFSSKAIIPDPISVNSLCASTGPDLELIDDVQQNHQQDHQERSCPSTKKRYEKRLMQETFPNGVRVMNSIKQVLSISLTAPKLPDLFACTAANDNEKGDYANPNDKKNESTSLAEKYEKCDEDGDAPHVVLAKRLDQIKKRLFYDWPSTVSSPSSSLSSLLCSDPCLEGIIEEEKRKEDIVPKTPTTTLLPRIAPFQQEQQQQPQQQRQDDQGTSNFATSPSSASRIPAEASPSMRLSSSSSLSLSSTDIALFDEDSIVDCGNNKNGDAYNDNAYEDWGMFVNLSIDNGSVCSGGSNEKEKGDEDYYENYHHEYTNRALYLLSLPTFDTCDTIDGDSKCNQRTNDNRTNTNRTADIFRHHEHNYDIFATIDGWTCSKKQKIN